MAKSMQADNNVMAQAGWRASLLKLQSFAVDVCLNGAGLAIGTAKAKVLIANTVYALVNGTLVKKTTAEIVLAGTVTADLFNVYVLSINASGTVAVTMGTEAATIGAVVFPTVPADSAVIGFVLVNPTGTGNFVGGTTELDDATVVPNAVYFDTAYPFNQNAMAL